MPWRKSIFRKEAAGSLRLISRVAGNQRCAFWVRLHLAAIVVHVAETRTAVLHPASSTHRQLTDEQLVAAGITPGLIRFSCGIENIEDILEDLEQALAKA